jgi:hypothetical protein
MDAHELSGWLPFLLYSEGLLAIAGAWFLLPVSKVRNYLCNQLSVQSDLPWYPIGSSGGRAAEAACLNMVDTGADDTGCVEARTLRDATTSFGGEEFPEPILPFIWIWPGTLCIKNCEPEILSTTYHFGQRRAASRRLGSVPKPKEQQHRAVKSATEGTDNSLTAVGIKND